MINDKTQSSQVASSDDTDLPSVWISFCPDLGIYHYHREVEDEDVGDQKFTREELLLMVEGMMKAGKVEQIQELVQICAWARLFAHKIVVFYLSGAFRIFNPIPPETLEQEDSQAMKAFFDEWKKAHPTDDTIPVVAPFKSQSPSEE